MPEPYPVAPDAVADTARSFAADAPPGIPDPVGKLVAIHTHVRATVEYLDVEREPGAAQQPTTTLQRGRGNCSDQAVLVSSLCQAVGIDARIVEAVSSDPGGHAVPEACLDGTEPQAAVAALDDAYTRLGDAYDEYAVETDGAGTPWLPVDTSMARYVGDIQPLVPAGFVRRDADEWWWSAVATETGGGRFPGTGCVLAGAGD